MKNLKKVKIKKIRKKNNMDTGLFIMYGFLVLLAAGIFIYAKIDDRKEQKWKHQQQEQ